MSDAATLRPVTHAAVRPASSLAKLLTRALHMGASDLHMHSGAPILVRRAGVLAPMDTDAPLRSDRVEVVMRELVGDETFARIMTGDEIDMIASLEGVGRFRTSIFRQQRGFDGVFRLIPANVPPLDTLGLPDVVSSFIDHRTGLVLCTGPTGCGKSTTLASLLCLLAQNRREHILTLEDPIEFILPAGQARVNQRQIGRHSVSFAASLRAALREDPDVIAVTELRDTKTISLAMTAAETGHLVLGTMHTQGAVQTIRRLINAFPAPEQAQARTMLSESLRAVVSQRLLPRADGAGRVVAAEILIITQAVGNLIRDDKTFQLPSVMQVRRNIGMQLMDDVLAQMVQTGVITPEVARANGLETAEAARG